MASSHGRVLLFPKYVCCINTIVKWKPSVGDGGVGAREGRGSVPGDGQPRPAQPRRPVWRRRGPVSHHAVRPHRPYFLQTSLGRSNLERVRGGGGSWGKQEEEAARELC